MAIRGTLPYLEHRRNFRFRGDHQIFNDGVRIFYLLLKIAATMNLIFVLVIFLNVRTAYESLAEEIGRPPKGFDWPRFSGLVMFSFLLIVVWGKW